jgi:hypothetical protein
MGFFKKSDDPISERERRLNEEIAAIEAKIKSFNSSPSSEARPKVRPATLPHGSIAPSPAQASAPAPLRAPVANPNPALTAHSAPLPRQSEPVFEPVDPSRIKSRGDANDRHYNDMGMRKYDLVLLLDRIKRLFQGQTHSNPKLVNLLAAGSVQGLRSLRYEKRIARRRFIAVIIFVMLVLLAMFAMRPH